MMPTMPPDSHKISLKIIEAIKQHPVLYINDVKGISVKVQEFRQKVWKRISDELTLDPAWVRLRWKNLRDTYCRILKYKNKTEKGVRRKKWIFEDHLSFLKFPYESDYQPQCVVLTQEYIQDILDGGVTTEAVLEQLEDKNDEDYSEYLEVLEETTADPVLGDTEMLEDLDDGQQEIIKESISQGDSKTTQQQEIDNYVQQIQSKFRKIRPKRMKTDESSSMELSNSYSILKSPPFKSGRVTTINAIEPTSISPIIITGPPIVPKSPVVKSSKRGTRKDTTTNAEKPNDETPLKPFIGNTSTELFFNSMAKTVKLLPLKAQVDIKMAVCRIVTEAEVRYSKQNLAKNTQQFVTPPGMIPKLVLVPCSMIDKPGNR